MSAAFLPLPLGEGWGEGGLRVREPSAKYLAQAEPALLRGVELLATAPGGVAKLRQLILEFAIRGRLVTQDQADEPAKHLVTKSQAQRVALATRRKLPATQSDKSASYALPVGWCWSSLGEIGLISPRNDASDDIAASFVQMSSIPVAMMEPHATETRQWRDIKSGFTHFAEGDIGVAKITPCFENGKSTVFRGLVNRIGAGTTELHVVRPLGGVLPEYILAFLKSPGFLRNGEAVMTGSAGQKRMPRAYFEGTPFPLPPLAEQHRIVARVEELMKLCDALEQSGRLADEQHARLTSTLFDALAASESAHALAENWQRIAEHFDLLLDRPEAIDALEQTILQLAVRGLLVPQDVRDEPAAKLLQRIDTEEATLIESGDAKHAKEAKDLELDTVPFELPSLWVWVRFNRLIRADKPIAYGVLVPGPDVTDGVPLVRLADLSLTDPPAHPAKSIGAGVDAQFPRTRLDGGEILMGVVGSIGKLGVAPESWRGANIARAICRIVPVNSVNKEFVLLLLQSQFMRERFVSDTRTLAQPTLNIGLIRSCPVPVPPLAEQHRIVARVEELRRLCAQLRKRLTEARQTQALLADALVAQATAA